MVSPDTSKILVVVNRGTMGPDNLKFGLPKGHVEKKEQISQCAMRELREETGLVARVFRKDVKVVVSETTYYLVKAHACIPPTPHDCTEIGDSRWVTWDDIMSTDCNRGLRLIRDKLKKKESKLMTQLRELKPRKIGKCFIKPSVNQKVIHAPTINIKRASILGSEEAEDDYDGIELP